MLLKFLRGGHRYDSHYADEEIWRRRSPGPCSLLVMTSLSFKPLHLLSREEPPPFSTPCLLLLFIETMEKRLALPVAASLIGEQGGPDVLKSTH